MKKNEKIDIRKSILNVTYIFLGLFVMVIGYFAYFMIVRSNDVINNTYNRRHSVLEERIIRGKILAADGEVLARTLVDEEGNETREYPYDSMFAHVVGRVSKGRTGIEETENIRMLTSNTNTLENMYNQFVGFKNLGNNVITTLDVDLQKLAYDALGDNRGSVVVIEPKTGKILAMVSKPDYDPNRIDEQWEELIQNEGEASPLVNRATQGLYPPGSTFKIMTALAYIRQNPDYLNYEYECKGHISYENMTIRCFRNAVHGKVDLPISMAKSCNTSFSFIGSKLNLDSFYALNESFLFNQRLPLPMVSSVSSFALNSGSGMKEVMQTAIGQGKTLISPMHNAMIVATIANGGVMMRPYVVDRVENARGQRVRKYVPQTLSTPMTPEEAEYMSLLLREVVTKGTATELQKVNTAVAGKTGSAEVSNRPAHAWFVGFAPYDQPEIVVSVIVENKGTGSEHAVPIARTIFDAYFNY